MLFLLKQSRSNNSLITKHLITRNSIRNTTKPINSIMNPISRFNFSDSNELKKIKDSLRDEEKTLFNRLSERFQSFNQTLTQKTPTIINHTNKEIDAESLNKPNFPVLEEEFSRGKFNIKNLKKTADEDLKAVNDLYQFQSEKLSKRTYSIDAIETFIEKLKKISNTNLFFEDKRFQIFLSDLLFIVNDSPTAKELFHLTFLAFLFNYYGNVKEFNEKMFARFLRVIRVSEVLDLLLVLKYFKQVNKDNYVTEGCVHVVTEINVRLDPNIYKRNKNILIENDELAKILVTFNDLGNLDQELIESFNRYIGENIDSFSISELIEYSLFFVHNPEQRKEFANFFRKEIYEKKLKRNMKNMSADKIYNMCFTLYNFKLFDLKDSKNNHHLNNKNIEVFRTVLETLLKNDSLNQDLQEYLIIKDSRPDLIYDLVNLIAKIIEESGVSLFDSPNAGNDLKIKLDEKTNNLINLLFQVVFHYFITNQKILTVEQTFNFVAVLNKKKLIEEKMLNEVFLGLTEKISAMDHRSLAKFLNFALENETNLKTSKKLKNNLINLLMKSNDAKIVNETILFFTRSKDLEFLSVTNLDFIFNKLKESFFEKIEFGNSTNSNSESMKIASDSDKGNEIIQFELGNKIKMLWNVSNLVEIIKLNFDKTERSISEAQNTSNDKSTEALTLSDLEANADFKFIKSDLSNFTEFFTKAIKLLINSKHDDLAKITVFEISLVFHALKNFQKFEYFFSNFTSNLNQKPSLTNQNYKSDEIENYFLTANELQETNSQIKTLLEKIENIVFANLKQLGLIEFLLVFSTYCDKRCISDQFTEACLEIIVNSLDQFSLYQLDLITYSLENNNVKNAEVLGLINRMKIYLTKKIIEKSVEDVDINIIKESINEIIEEEKKSNSNDKQNKQFKKLI